jgi:hypothetical protein
VKHVCTDNGFSTVSYYAAFRDTGWLQLLIDIREALYPYQRNELAHRIVKDAMIPLRDAFRVEQGPKNVEVIPFHASVVKSREQAATILGLQLKQPDISFSKSQNEIVHTFKNLPDKVVEEFANTGIWDDKWGPKPWEKG